MTVQDVKLQKDTITLRGVVYEIRYTMNSFAEMQDKYGSINKTVEAISDSENMDFKALRFFIWTGLLADQPKLTELEVGNLIGLKEMKSSLEVFSKCFTSAMPNEGTETPEIEGPK